jgi:autotransporter-associated beta strand protein
MNPTFSGTFFPVGRIVLANDGAMGGNRFRGGGTFISDDDNRVISANISMPNDITFRGASEFEEIADLGDHSIELSGDLEQTNTRAIVNEIPYDYQTDTGKTLTLAGDYYPLQGEDNDDSDRILTIQGSGKTLVTGGIHNRPPDATFAGNGHLRKRGSGTVVIGYDSANTEATPTDHNGFLWMEDGNLHYATNEDLPAGSILSRGGAVGSDDPEFGTTGNAAFLGKLNNSLNPNATYPDPNFLTFFVIRPVYTTYSHGGLMLAEGEYSEDLNFTGTQAANPLARAANMSLAARPGGSTYTGTITPAGPSDVPSNANTYQLGGGAGRLTLPNDNQLVDDGGTPRMLLVTNGAEVRLQGTNTYTGTTRVIGVSLTSNDEGVVTTTQSALRTILTIDELPNAGMPSNIGNSSNAASNLLIHGSTLRYVGAATNTDRLFTVGTAGATIESSGAGTLTFGNTAPLGIDVAEDRNGITHTAAPGSANNEIFGRADVSALFPFQTEDLRPGMRVISAPPASGAIPDNLVITGLPGPNVVTVGGAGFSGFAIGAGMFNFGPAPARFLTLDGTNTGDNTLAPLVGNASDIVEANVAETADGFGTVGIRKTGPGKWILTNDNTYSGETRVEEGTLVVNGMQTGGGLTTVSTGALLAGNGAVGGSLTNNGTVAPGTSAGKFTVNGDFNQSVDGTLQIELGGSGAGMFDSIELIGTDFMPVAGDYNNNGLVDTADYTVWRDHLGQTFQLSNEGEGISEGTVDQDDYEFWVSNFGQVASQSTGIATLEGTIDVSLINGFNPSSGSWTILTADGVVEGEAGVTLTGAPGFSLMFNASSLVLNYIGVASGSLAGGVVPEPTSALLAVLASIALVGTRQKRCQSI